MDKVIVIRHSDDQHENKEIAKISLNDDSASNFEDYFLKYGKHFSPKLLKYALDGIDNKDTSNHRWNCQLIKDSLDKLKYTIPSTSTIEDITYTANMAYADFYPDILSEDLCIQYSMLVANDIDGYEGILFYRWVSDQIGKGIIVDFRNYM